MVGCDVLLTARPVAGGGWGGRLTIQRRSNSACNPTGSLTNSSCGTQDRGREQSSNKQPVMSL